MQYYASTVDNLRYGSGNNVLHNVVGGTVGVSQVATCDPSIEVGLRRRSLHGENDLVHVPQHRSVSLEAPLDAIDAMTAKHGQTGNLAQRRIPRGWERSEHV